MNETDRQYPAKPEPKRIRVVLRDHALLEARVHIAGGQFLITFLAGRKRYISLTKSVWMATEEPVDYMLLKVDRILWVSSPDQAIPLMNVLGATAPKQVEISVEGGLVIRAGLALGARQRLSDYLATAQEFIPLTNAIALPREAVLGDIALNQDAIRSIREIRPKLPPEELAATLEADAS